MIYTGSDDGLIHVSKDAGNTWTRISDNLPQNLWVSRVQASAHDEGTVYASLNGYRWDDFNSYIYKSTDYGENWSRIGLDLPNEPVNVIKEDPNAKGILYVGTDHGAYVSIDDGNSFMSFEEGLSAAPVHDIVIQSREKHILIGTHGRSIYKAENHTILKLNEVKDEEIYVYDIPDFYYSSNYGQRQNAYRKPAEPEVKIPVYAKEKGKVKLELKSSSGLLLYSDTIELPKGISYITYDTQVQLSSLKEYQSFLNEELEEGSEEITLKTADNGKLYLKPGKYEISLSKNDKKSNSTLKVKERGSR